jgi:hypothetical protein
MLYSKWHYEILKSRKIMDEIEVGKDGKLIIVEK